MHLYLCVYKTHKDNRSVQLSSSHLHYILQVIVSSVFNLINPTKARFMVFK